MSTEIISIFAGAGFGIFAFVLSRICINSLKKLAAEKETKSIYMTDISLGTLLNA